MKATTFRIDPVVQTGLSMLSKILGRPQNQFVNEAVRDFVARRSREVEMDLEVTLEALRASRKNDPKLERAIEDYVDAEASLKEDPAEGRRMGAYRESATSRRVAPGWPPGGTCPPGGWHRPVAPPTFGLALRPLAIYIDRRDGD
jgi:predicted transcriptional regulator